MSTISRQKEIFLAAREITHADERTRFLDSSCGDDEALRLRVERMLTADSDPSALFGSPDLPEPQVGEKVGYFGDYVLLGEIARGGSGIVFRARQVSLDRVVALKMLRDRGLFTSSIETERLRAEAAAAAALDHPNIVPIHEVGVHDDQPYFSMKFVDGGTLQWRMAEFQSNPPKAVALMAKIARAVHHAHSRGMLHRDLKPGNILVDHAGEPHITDFGLARRMGQVSQLSITGQIVGTPHYMAPEQIRGIGRNLTPGVDIYGMGAMLYELLEGRRPFDADDLIELFRLVAESPPPSPRRAPTTLAPVVLKCLAKNPAERHATAEILALELERWLDREAVAPDPASLNQPIESSLSRRRWLLAAGGGVAAAAAAFLWSRSEAPRARSSARTPIVNPATSAPAAPDPTRAAAEWITRMNGPHGYLEMSPIAGERRRFTAAAAIPAGEWRIEDLSFDHFQAREDLRQVDPADFSHHGAILKHLWRLQVRELNLPTECFAFLPRNIGLTHITFSAVPVDDGILEFIAPLKALVQLSIVQTKRFNRPFTGQGMERLASLSNLVGAIFYGNDLIDATILTLADRCPRLEHVVLSDSPRLTENSLLSLVACRELRHLDLCGTRLTDKCLAAFTACRNLKELVVQRTSLSDAAIAEFRQSLPECTVTR